MGLQMCAALHLLEITRGELDQILYVTNITLNALHCSDPNLLKLLWETARVVLWGMGGGQRGCPPPGFFDGLPNSVIQWLLQFR